MLLAEKLLDSKARVIIVDPLDVYWGLRLRKDGNAAGWPVVIFGGSHADLPITETSGGVIGEAAATMAESCIVSLGDFGTKSAMRRFMLAFLEKLYAAATREPVHVIFDEADLWAPQKSSEPQLQALCGSGPAVTFSGGREHDFDNGGTGEWAFLRFGVQAHHRDGS